SPSRPTTCAPFGQGLDCLRGSCHRSWASAPRAPHRAAPPYRGISLPTERVVFGTANLGMPYGRSRWRGVPSKAAAFELLDAAWSVGIRTFDTAEAYELAPERLREWLDARAVARCARGITKVSPLPARGLAQALQHALARFADW